MSKTVNLIQSDDLQGCPFPFFDDTPKAYKIYNDGRHLIATPCRHAQAPAAKAMRKTSRRRRPKEYTDEQKEVIYNRLMCDKRKDYERGKRNTSMRIDISSNKGFGGTRSAFDILFDDLFTQGYNKGLRDRKMEKPMSDYIHDGLRTLFTEEEIAKVDIAERVKRKLNNLHHRKKRFRRKAYLNRWNFFVTVTCFYRHYLANIYIVRHEKMQSRSRRIDRLSDFFVNVILLNRILQPICLFYIIIRSKNRFMDTFVLISEIAFRGGLS